MIFYKGLSNSYLQGILETQVIQVSLIKLDKGLSSQVLKNWMSEQCQSFTKDIIDFLDPADDE